MTHSLPRSARNRTARLMARAARQTGRMPGSDPNFVRTFSVPSVPESADETAEADGTAESAGSAPRSRRCAEEMLQELLQQPASSGGGSQLLQQPESSGGGSGRDPEPPDDPWDLASVGGVEPRHSTLDDPLELFESSSAAVLSLRTAVLFSKTAAPPAERPASAQEGAASSPEGGRQDEEPFRDRESLPPGGEAGWAEPPDSAEPHAVYSMMYSRDMGRGNRREGGGSSAVPAPQEHGAAAARGRRRTARMGEWDDTHWAPPRSGTLRFISPAPPPLPPSY